MSTHIGPQFIESIDKVFQKQIKAKARGIHHHYSIMINNISKFYAHKVRILLNKLHELGENPPPLPRKEKWTVPHRGAFEWSDDESDYVFEPNPVATARPITANPVVTAKFIAAANPVITAKPIAAANPVITAKPTVTSNPVVTARPIVTANPVVTAKHIITPNTAVTANPVTANPVITARPIVTSNPVVSAKSIVTTNPVAIVDLKLPDQMDDNFVGTPYSQLQSHLDWNKENTINDHFGRDPMDHYYWAEINRTWYAETTAIKSNHKVHKHMDRRKKPSKYVSTEPKQTFIVNKTLNPC